MFYPTQIDHTQYEMLVLVKQILQIKMLPHFFKQILQIY